MVAGVSVPTTNLRLCKVCDLPDWEDPEFLAMLDELNLSWAKERKHRKAWEFAQGVRVLNHLGALTPDAVALGVGAGHEAPLFYFANRVREVHATDIYGDGPFAEGEGSAEMLTDPARFAPFPYREDHLVVKYMDGRDLRYPDSSFDMAFSFSSIEHFGGHQAASRSMQEISRVLRPGGTALITTEVILNEVPHEEFFLPAELHEWLVYPTGLELVEDIDLTISPSLLHNPVNMDAFLDEIDELWAFARCDRMLDNPGWSAGYRDRLLPYVVLQSGPVVFTSVIMALQKTGGRDGHGAARPSPPRSTSPSPSPPLPSAGPEGDADFRDGGRPDRTLQGRLQARARRALPEVAAKASSTLGAVAGLPRRLGRRGLSHLLGQRNAPLLATLREVTQQLDALDSKLSEVVAGMELGSVPSRETRYLGRPFVYPYDSTIGEAIDGGREWDAVLRTIVSGLVPQEEPTICEVGSNIGASLLQILAAKPRARVVAIEPSARFRPFLSRNLELAGFGEVEVLPVAVGSSPGSVRLHKYNTTASTVSESLPGLKPLGPEVVDVTTLDELFRDRSPVHFIKVDTDGLDFEVLRGAEARLARDRPVLHFELAPYCLAELAPTAAVDGLTWLQGQGYRRFACLNPAGQLVGRTEDPDEAIAWADDNVYCDVVVCPTGSSSEALLAGMEFG